MMEWKKEKSGKIGKNYDYCFLLSKPSFIFNKKKFQKIVLNKTMILSLDCKYLFKLAIGDVYVWGNHMDGLLGLGYNITDVNYPTKLESLKNISEISMSDTHALAINTNGNVFSWGQGKYGELCLEKTIFSPFPAKMVTTKLYKKAFCGELLTCLIDINDRFSYFGVIIKIFKESNYKTTFKNLWKNEANLDPIYIFKEKIIIGIKINKQELYTEKFTDVKIGNGFIGILSEKGSLYTIDYSDNMTLLYSKFKIYSIAIANDKLFSLSREKKINDSLIYFCRWETTSQNQSRHELWKSHLYSINHEFYKDNNVFFNSTNNSEFLLMYLSKTEEIDNYLNQSEMIVRNAIDKSVDITSTKLSVEMSAQGFEGINNANILTYLNSFDDSYNTKFKRIKNVEGLNNNLKSSNRLHNFSMSFLERSKLKNVIQNTTSLILEEKRNLDTNSFENQINSNDNMSNHYEYEERDQFFNDLVFDGNINRNSSLSQKEYNKVNDIKSSGNDNHEENTCNNYKNEGIYSKFTIEKVSNFYNFFEIINLTFVKKYFYRIFFINKKKFGLKYCIEDSISINNRDKEIKINNILSFEKMNFIEFSNKNIEKFISILFNFIHNLDNLTKKKTIYFFKNKKEENFDTTPKEKNIVYIKSILSNSVRTYSSKIKKTNKKSNSGISYLIENNQEPSSIDNSDPPPILKKELSQKINSIDNSIEGLLNSNNNNYFESVYCTPLNNQKFIRFTSKIDNKENSNDLFKDSNKIATLKDSFNTNSLNLINLEDTKNDAFNNNESSNDLFFKKIKNSSENERRITLMNEVNQKYINLIENINRSNEKEKIINHDQTIKILNNKDNSTGLNENSDKDLQMSNNIIHQVLISKEKENNQMNYKSKDFDHHENENDNLKKINTIENKNSLIFSLNFANSVENNYENKNKILNNLQSSNSLLNSKNDFFIKEITIKSKNKFSKNKIIDKQLYKLNDKKSGLNISNSNNINENETRNIIRNNMKNTFEIDNSQDLVNKNYLDKNLIENNNDNSQISNQNNHYLEDNDIFSKISEEIKIEDNSDKRYQSFDIENVLNKLPIETYVSKNNMKIKEISIENNTINVKKSEMATINNNNNYEKTNIILSKEVDLDTKGIIIKTNDTQDNINTNLNHYCLINESKLTKSENTIFLSENPTSNLKRIDNPANNLNQANFSKYSKDIDKKVYFSEINQKLNSDFSKNSEIEDSQIDNVEDKNYNLPLSTKFENRIFTPKFKNRNNNQSLDTINSEKKNSTAMTTLILNELKTQFNNQTIEDVKKPIKFYFLEPSNKILIQIVSASYKPNLNSNEGSSLHNFKIISESNCCIFNSNHDFNSIAISATINNLNAANWEKVLSVCNEISIENICQISQINENVNMEGTNNLIPKSEFKEDIIKIIDTDFINLDFNTQTFQNILNNEIDTLQPNQDVILNDLPIYSQDIINEDYPKFKIEINNKYPITNKRNVCKKDLTLNHKVKTYKNSTSSTNDFSQFKNKNEIFHKSTNLNNNYSIYFKRKSIDKFSNNSAAISHKKTKDLKNDAESKNNGINFDSQIISQTFSDDNNISSLNFKPNIVRENFFHTSSTKTEDLIMSNRSNNNNEEFSIEKEKKDALDVNFKRNSNSNKNIYFKNKNLLFEENNLNNFSNIRKNDINIKNNYLSNSDICNNNKTIPISTLKYDDINKKKILEKQYSSYLESQKLPLNSVYKTVNDCPYKTEMLESKDFYKNSESVKESELFKKVLTNHFSLNRYSENDKNKYKSNLAKNENSNNNIVNRNLYQNLKIDNSVNLSKISQKKIDLEENEKFNSTLTDLYLNTNDKSKSNLIISKKISNNSNDDVKQIKGINSKSLSIDTLSNQFKNMIKILVFILEKLFVKNKKIFFMKLPQKLNILSSSISKTYIEKKNHVSNNQNKNKSTLINRNKYFSEEYLSINKKRVISSKIIIKLIKRRLIFFKLIFFNRVIQLFLKNQIHEINAAQIFSLNDMQ